MFRRRAVLVALAATVALTGCSEKGSHATRAAAIPPQSATPTPTAQRVPVLPVLKEVFDLLDCDQNTTIGMEGCAERDVLKADRHVNALVRRLWRIDDLVGRRLLAAAQASWVAYRDAACRSDADVYRDGTQSPVEYGMCAANLTNERAAFLAGQYALATQGS